MKSSILVIIVPIAIATLVTGSVLVMRYLSPVPRASEATLDRTSTVSAIVPSLTVPTGVPIVGFDKIQSTEPVSDLRQAFVAARDTVAEDFQDLEKTIDAL